MPSEYEFTNNWFEPHMVVWRQIIQQLSPKRILEVGSYEGRSACFLIEECKSLEELVCIDTWAGNPEWPGYDREKMPQVERRFDSNTLLAQSRRPQPIVLRKIKDLSSQALASLIGNKEPHFDLVYVDGSHEAPNVLTDAVNAFHLLRIGGVLVFDDYIWRDEVSRGKDVLNVPKIAIDAFVNIFHRKVVVLSAILYQLYVRKTAA
jgi:predicted O-methyltransferase YrrM